MGLDMYLQEKIYIGNGYKDKKEQVKVIVPKNQEKTWNKVKPIDNSRIDSITLNVITWRKANMIHNWFVENVQEGQDDCGEYYCDPEQLETLRDICKEILDNSELVDGTIQNGTEHTKEGTIPIMEEGKYIKDPSTAERLLPTTSGFFFGSTDYNQWYLEDIKTTYEELEEALRTNPQGSFYYSSSW